MRLPPLLEQTIQLETGKTDRGELSRAVAELIQRYKSERHSPAITTPPQRAAYLAVRMPATFAASLRVLSEIQRLAPQVRISSLLDLGAGPGTAAYAAVEVFPALSRITLVEADPYFIDAGRRISRQLADPAIRDSLWLQRDLASGPLESHDLVMASYTLNELSPDAVTKALSQAWQCTREFLALVEPGTKRGFNLIHQARAQLVAEGAHILAPCPHEHECPMAAVGDWCHFAQRVERTAEHRRLKSGVLGHEDEKFSYIVAGRQPLPGAKTRIVRHPQKHTGHVQLLLCASLGLEKRTITKSQKEKYKLARQAAWGDGWD